MTVPAEIVERLREATFAAVGKAGEAINEAAFANDRGENPEWFTVPTNDLVEMYELLEVIGWKAPVPPVGVQVDLWAHGRVLMRALRGALDFAEADAEEAARVPAEPSGRARSVERDVEARQVEVLRGFIVVARARLDAIERGDA